MQQPYFWTMIAAIAAVVYPGLGILGWVLKQFIQNEVLTLDLKITGDGGPIDELKERVRRLESPEHPVKACRVR